MSIVVAWINARKKAQEDVRIGNNKLQQAREKLDYLKGIEPVPDYARTFPGWYAPVVIVENGKRVVKPIKSRERRRMAQARSGEPGRAVRDPGRSGAAVLQAPTRGVTLRLQRI